jgi:tetratricopeptide (TPR) repeat protein
LHHHWNHGGWHGIHDGWHSWHHGYWGGWGGWPAVWFGGGTAGWGGSSYYYNNPYYTGGVAGSVGLNYSQPIAASQANAADAAPTAAQKQALAAMDAARAAFKRGDYPLAERDAEKAIGLMADDPALHEFRALTLFAQKKYQESAAAVHAVLASGPGWDEQTVQSLYGDPKVYTGQVKSLQDYVRQNPKVAYARFLLAYHQLTAGQRDEARKELDRVVELQPDDQLAIQLTKALAMTHAEANATSRAMLPDDDTRQSAS